MWYNKRSEKSMKGQCERCMFEDTDECEAVMKNNEC